MLNEPFDNRIKFHILSEKIFLDSFNEKLIRSIFEETKFTHFEIIEKRKNVHVFMRCQFQVAKTPRNKNRFNEMLSCAFNNFRVWFIFFFLRRDNLFFRAVHFPYERKIKSICLVEKFQMDICEKKKIYFYASMLLQEFWLFIKCCIRCKLQLVTHFQRKSIRGF